MAETVNTVYDTDFKHNRVLDSIATTESGMGVESFNFYKYGVNYDPYKEYKGYYSEDGSFTRLGNKDYNALATPTVSAVDDQPLERSGGSGEWGYYRNGIRSPNNWTTYDGEVIAKGPNGEDIITTTRAERGQYDPDDHYSQQEYETDMLAANKELLPLSTDMMKSNLKTQKVGLRAERQGIRQQSTVLSQLYRDALSGTSEASLNAAADRAQADAVGQYEGAVRESSLAASRRGYGIGSGAGMASLAGDPLDRAKVVGLAKTAGRENQRQVGFQNLTTAAGISPTKYSQGVS